MERKNSKEILKEFVMSKSKYLRIKDGETVQVKYLKAEECEVRGNDKIHIGIRYYFEHNGRKVLFERTNTQLADAMNDFDEGNYLSITRNGQYNKTKYVIKRVND